MKLAVLGCSIFKNEVEFLMPRITSKLDFYWLPQRLHKKPLELRRLIQEQIDDLERESKPYDAIVLLYGLCSKGSMGISSKKYRLVIPRVQDCIGMLLGSNERYAEHFKKKPGTYWYTKGWIETGFDASDTEPAGSLPAGNPPAGDTIADSRLGGFGQASTTPADTEPAEVGVLGPYRERFLEYRKKFSDEISRYLIHEWDQRWIKNYTTVAFIDWGIQDSARYRDRAKRNATQMGLEFQQVEGDYSLLLDLLNARWDEQRYIQVEPGQRLLPSYTDSVFTCSGSNGEISKRAPVKRTVEKGPSEKRSGLGLGIDAGGTYTDTVLYDFEREQVVASSKALTTHDDYASGIKESLDGLLKEISGELISRIGLVSLSTTLATNAIVEGKGGRVGLILIGYDRYTSAKVELGPKIVIRGRHTIEGELLEPLDSGEAEAAIKTLLKGGVDSFAVSSEVGARNPEHELEVKKLIEQKFDLPVVCASELTTELNCVKRANTCFFNARLVPLVASLLSSVKKVLSVRGIRAPLMVVKGDGTLMGEEVARTNPVEMVLSGPAASVIGGAYLSGVRDGYVVDMGGTTTDIAFIKDGFVAHRGDGIKINGFRTAVKTVNVHTFGLGGDSYIRYEDKIRKVRIGPQRVIPISFLAHRYPQLMDFFKKERQIRGEELLVQPADFFIFQKEFKGTDLHPQEIAILRVLREHGPMSRVELAERVAAVSISLIRTERLEMFGNILRSALTPTDVLHAIGAAQFWNSEAARSALRLYSERAGMSSDKFVEETLREFYRNLLAHLLEFWLTEDGRFLGEREFAENLASHLFFKVKDIVLDTEVRNPIVFIGAPALTYSQGIRDLVDVHVIVPGSHAVANAVGAITGSIREEVTILIRPTVEGGFVAYTPDEKRSFDSLAEAKHATVKLAERTAVQRARRSGALHLTVNVDVKDREVRVSQDDIIYLETVVTASVNSIPTTRVVD